MINTLHYYLYCMPSFVKSVLIKEIKRERDRDLGNSYFILLFQETLIKDITTLTKTWYGLRLQRAGVRRSLDVEL